MLLYYYYYVVLRFLRTSPIFQGLSQILNVFGFLITRLTQTFKYSLFVALEKEMTRQSGGDLLPLWHLSDKMLSMVEKDAFIRLWLVASIKEISHLTVEIVSVFLQIPLAFVCILEE